MSSRRLAAPTVAATLLLAACGGGDDATEPPAATTDRGGTPTIIPAPPPGSSAAAERGRSLVGQSGCLACHRIGSVGHDEPGPELSSVGAALPAPEIARQLVEPTPPMPSYAQLPARDRRAIVAYLAALRGPDRADSRLEGRNTRDGD